MARRKKRGCCRTGGSRAGTGCEGGRTGSPQVASRGLRVCVGANFDFSRKFIKFCFTWIRFFLQCCANAVFGITLQEALCTDMVESTSPTCETGDSVRRLSSARYHARVGLICVRRSGAWSRLSRARSSWIQFVSRRLFSRFSPISFSADSPRRRLHLWSRSDRSRHMRMLWSSSRLALSRFALQRLSGGVLPPQ